MILNDWKCPRHGDFEASHAICPTFGCDSTGVVKIFKKAPGVISAATRRFDTGLKQSAASYGLSDIRSARAGEAAYGGKHSNGVLWGDQVNQIMRPGGTLPGLMAAAGGAYKRPDGRTEYGSAYKMPDGSTQVVPHGMRQAATEIGVTKRALPRAERIVDPRDVARSA